MMIKNLHKKTQLSSLIVSLTERLQVLVFYVLEKGE